MSWKETGSGLYQRPLNAGEAGMVAAIASTTTRELIRIHAVADFAAPNTADQVTEAFKAAWKALRLLKSPDIATTFGDGHKHYKVASSQELEAWLNRTFQVTPTGTSVQATIKDMQRSVEFLPVCYILPHPTHDRTFKGSIILFISHWRTEAGGAFKIINQLFDYASDLLDGSTSIRNALANHKLGSEVELLTPALEDVLMPDRQSSPEAKARIQSLFADYSSKLPCVDLPMQGSFSTTPGYVKVNERIYTPASTASLVRACKAKGITVTSAVHSAYLGFVWHIAAPDQRNRPWTCMMPAEVRKRLPTSSPLRDQGCWNAAQMLLLSVPASEDFLTRARSLRQQYAIANQETWLHEDTRELSAQMVDYFVNTPPEPAATPWFTSLGVLDGDIAPEHGNLKIESVTAWADPLAPGIVLRLWTFRGRLKIQIVWNAAFHGDEQIQTAMDIIDKILAMELGIDMETEEVRLEEY